MKSVFFASVLVLLLTFSSANIYQSWQQCAPLPEKMSPACGVINKKIYAVSGCSNDFKIAGYISGYNPLTDAWLKKSQMPISKKSFQTFVFNNKLYTIGGISDSNGTHSKTLEEYDPVTDKWKQTTSMKTGREGIGYIVYKHKLYVFGGFKANNNIETNEVEVYDFSTDTWESRSPMPTGRAWARVCCLNDKIYLFGGFGNGKHQTAVEEYDPGNDLWTKKNPVPHEEPIQFAKTISNEIYAIFSFFRTPSKAYTAKYDPVNDSWTNLAQPLQNSFFDYAGIALEQNILLVSGFQNNANNVIKTVQCFDIIQNKWRMLPEINFGRVAMGAELIDNTIYIIGGQFGWYTNPIQYTDSVEKLDLSKFINNIN